MPPHPPPGRSRYPRSTGSSKYETSGLNRLRRRRRREIHRETPEVPFLRACIFPHSIFTPQEDIRTTAAAFDRSLEVHRTTIEGNSLLSSSSSSGTSSAASSSLRDSLPPTLPSLVPTVLVNPIPQRCTSRLSTPDRLVPTLQLQLSRTLSSDETLPPSTKESLHLIDPRSTPILATCRSRAVDPAKVTSSSSSQEEEEDR